MSESRAKWAAINTDGEKKQSTNSRKKQNTKDRNMSEGISVWCQSIYKYAQATLDGTKDVSVKTQKRKRQLAVGKKLENCERIGKVPEPKIPLNVKEVSDVVKKLDKYHQD